MALARAPWLYEAKLLAGHAARGQAHEARASGRHEDSLELFSLARNLYGEAAEIGESDPVTHLAVCSVAADAMEVLFFDSGSDVRRWLGVAQESCDRSHRAKPDSADPDITLSVAHLTHARQQMERGEEALPTLATALAAGQRALEVEPDNEAAHRAIGDAYLYRSDYLQQHGEDPIPDLDASIASFERAIELNPSYPDAYKSLGTAYVDRIRLELERGLDPQPSFTAAVSALTTATDILPSYTGAYLTQGIIHRLQGEHLAAIGKDPKRPYERAVDCYRTVIELNPSHSYAHNNLGNVLRDIGECDLSHGLDPRHTFDEALRCFRTASELNPEWAFRFSTPVSPTVTSLSTSTLAVVIRNRHFGRPLRTLNAASSSSVVTPSPLPSSHEPTCRWLSMPRTEATRRLRRWSEPKPHWTRHWPSIRPFRLRSICGAAPPWCEPDTC